MATVKMGVSRLSGTELVPKAQGIHDGLKNNAGFPSPLPTLADFQSYIDKLAAANAAVEANGGKAEHTAKRVSELQVRSAIKSLAAYVQNTSGGDATLIKSTNFEVSKRGTPYGELKPPAKLLSVYTTTTGRVALRWKREAGCDMHHVYMSTSAEPFNWQLIGSTTKSRFDANDLQPGTFYYFAVSALGAAGETSKCEPCRAMAAA